MYKVKARYYADEDCFGESYVLTSDNGDVDTRLEIGDQVHIVPLSSMPCITSAPRRPPSFKRFMEWFWYRAMCPQPDKPILGSMAITQWLYNWTARRAGYWHKKNCSRCAGI